MSMRTISVHPKPRPKTRGVVLLSILGAVSTVSVSGQVTQTQHTVTFYRDVLPILQQHCQECHREGEIAPFAMMTYEQTRPWAKAIRDAVLGRVMPPWFAADEAHIFSNDRRLSKRDIETIAAWVDTGAPKGNAQDAPNPRQFVTGWRIGTPDMVVSMPDGYQVPQSGEVPWQYFTAHTNFKEDRWVRALEVRPGDSAVVHHIRVFAREPGSKAFMELNSKLSDERQHPRNAPLDNGAGVLAGPNVGSGELATYVPGGDPLVLNSDYAVLVKAGSDIVFEVHYAPNGKAVTDRSRIGLVFAAHPPKMQVTEVGLANVNLRIPAGAPNHQVDSNVTLREDMWLLSLWPHMHFRGKSLQLTALYPSGESEVLLDVPHYNFNWQMSYVLSRPRLLPKGTELRCVTHFDNSSDNPYNPDPNVDVYWGEQTWEEMNMAFLRVALPPGLRPVDVAIPPRK
jgi:hypothetical protein